MTSSNKDIEIANIEQTLSALHEAKEGCTQIHASLFNLLMFAQNAAHADDLRSIINAIMSKFPCRVIIIQQTPTEAQPRIKIDVSSQIVKKIACDVITVDSAPEYIQRVPFILMPHLIPDLPLYLLWGSSPIVEDPILPYFLSIAKRIIFSFDSPPHDLPKVTRKLLDLQNSKPFLQVTDLAWTYITSWKLILQQIFDSPEEIKRLQTATSLRVHYNSQKGQGITNTENSAIYFVCWLATRLQWEIDSIDLAKGQFVFKYNKSLTVVTIEPKEDPERPPGTIVSLELSALDDYYYSISPIPNQSKVMVHISTLMICELPYTLSLPSLKKEFPYSKELLYTPLSDQYKQTLELIASL